MFGLFTNQMRVNNLNLQTYLLIEASKKGFPDQCGKFVLRARDIGARNFDIFYIFTIKFSKSRFPITADGFLIHIFPRSQHQQQTIRLSFLMTEKEGATILAKS
jgi:hypothetical protein